MRDYLVPILFLSALMLAGYFVGLWLIPVVVYG